MVTSTIPTKRLGEPSDVAELATFVVLDGSSYTTGGDFVIDGGGLL